jgi:hypothetical protein
MLFAVLVFAAVMLTSSMVKSKNAILGFPCGIMWGLAGGVAIIESIVAWDIWFIVGFAFLLGMVTFTIFGAYGLREKRDTIGDEEMEQGDKDMSAEPLQSSGGGSRADRLHARAKARRSKVGDE